MKRFSYVFLCLLLAVSIFSVACTNDKSAINEVTVGFVSAYQNQQYSLCLDYLSNRFRTSTGDQSLINRMQLARLFSGTSKLKNIGEPTLNGDSAKVWVDIEGLLGFTNSVQLSFLRENGEWKIDGF